MEEDKVTRCWITPRNSKGKKKLRQREGKRQQGMGRFLRQKSIVEIYTFTQYTQHRRVLFSSYRYSWPTLQSWINQRDLFSSVHMTARDLNADLCKTCRISPLTGNCHKAGILGWGGGESLWVILRHSWMGFRTCLWNCDNSCLCCMKSYVLIFVQGKHDDLCVHRGGSHRLHFCENCGKSKHSGKSH